MEKPGIDLLHFFNKQLALAWQIAKQHSGLSPPFTKQQYKLKFKEKLRFSFAINVK